MLFCRSAELARTREAKQGIPMNEVQDPFEKLAHVAVPVCQWCINDAEADADVGIDSIVLFATWWTFDEPNLHGLDVCDDHMSDAMLDHPKLTWAKYKYATEARIVNRLKREQS